MSDKCRGQWIPVSEPPKKEGWYYTYDIEAGDAESPYSLQWYSTKDKDFTAEWGQPTHWMEKPEPPKESA